MLNKEYYNICSKVGFPLLQTLGVPNDIINNSYTNIATHCSTQLKWSFWRVDAIRYLFRAGLKEGTFQSDLEMAISCLEFDQDCTVKGYGARWSTMDTMVEFNRVKDTITAIRVQLELPIEVKFAEYDLRSRLSASTPEQIIEFTVDLHHQFKTSEKLYRDLIKHQWGI